MSKKEDIKSAFIDLIIEKGIRNVNMSDVFVKAETGSGTFYNYYKSKEDLIEELFFDQINDMIDSIRVDLPKGYEITDIKPLVMAVLDNIIEVMDTKTKTLQILEILSPEFNKKDREQSLKSFEEFKKNHERANDAWFWFNEIILKGQELHQIVNLNSTLVGKMIVGAFSHLFVPKIKKEKFKNLDGNKEWQALIETKFAKPEEINLIKECIWNMITIH